MVLFIIEKAKRKSLMTQPYVSHFLLRIVIDQKHNINHLKRNTIKSTISKETLSTEWSGLTFYIKFIILFKFENLKFINHSYLVHLSV
jgi:hypothetical protein